MTRVVVYDTEFIDDGHTIDLISIGCVDNFGREFYAVSTDFDASRAGPWVRQHVLPHLPHRDGPSGFRWMSRLLIAARLYDWLVPIPGKELELWADHAAYDHVALAQLWGPMTDLPAGVPMFTHELQQLWEQVGRPEIEQQLSAWMHDALYDARHGMKVYKDCISRVEESSG